MPTAARKRRTINRTLCNNCFEYCTGITLTVTVRQIDSRSAATQPIMANTMTKPKMMYAGMSQSSGTEPGLMAISTIAAMLKSCKREIIKLVFSVLVIKWNGIISANSLKILRLNIFKCRISCWFGNYVVIFSY